MNKPSNLYRTALGRNDCAYGSNKSLAKYNWLKLTPAYSLKLVEEIISKSQNKTGHLLDPFAGSGTTGLAATQLGYKVDLYEINPFLCWLIKAKFEKIKHKSIKKTHQSTILLKKEIQKYQNQNLWKPQYHNIERWWAKETIIGLAVLKENLEREYGEIKNNQNKIVWVAFFQTVAETLNVKHNHISLTLKSEKEDYNIEEVIEIYTKNLNKLLKEDSNHNNEEINLYNEDARLLKEKGKYNIVITSPPYANRVSYVRELRPYLYWGNFIQTAEDAGELDWQAIGGTWGTATRKLKRWKPDRNNVTKFTEKYQEAIKKKENKYADLIATYVGKYFYDIFLHFEALTEKLAPNAEINYVVGNSSFYKILIPTEMIYMDMLKELGFEDIKTRLVRQRNYNKNLYEYCVTARWNK